MSQKILVILYQTIALSVINYSFGLLTISAALFNRLEIIQNESLRAILDCTKDITVEAHEVPF